jgi:hypothetical protein
MRFLWAAIVLGACAACGSGKSQGDARACNDGTMENSINGSYCEGVPFNYTDVRISRYPDAMSTEIEYRRCLGTGVEKTLFIIIQEMNVVIMANTPIDILKTSGNVQRVLPDGAQDLTPELDSSKPNLVTFTEWTGTANSHVAGKFGFTFKSGRVLGGYFDGPLIVPDPNNPPPACM